MAHYDTLSMYNFFLWRGFYRPHLMYVFMEKPYIDLYKEFAPVLKKHSAEVMNRYRDEAFALFEELGFPANRQEHYLYTDLREPLSVDYGLNINRLSIPVDPYRAFKCDVPGISSYLYFVVNDVFFPAKNTAVLPEGVIVGSLKEVAEREPALVERYYSRLTQKKRDGIVAFNTAFAQDGFFVYVPENVVLDKPLQIVNIMRSDVDFMANSHNVVVLEQGAKAAVLVCDHTMDDVRFLANRVTEVFVGKGASYEHYKLENTSEKNTNLSTLLIEQQEGSHVLGNVITLHNGVTRNTIEIALEGEHCETMLCGMALSDREQRVDNFTSILHNKPNCHSNELFKYVLDDASFGGFTGRLVVAQDAQKTQAYQSNKNLLLSKEARMRTKPQLEIYADDVKCSHGATIGQLDEEALFYLRSRGISKQEARLLLMFAFTADIIEHINIDLLQDRIRMLVEKRLRHGTSKCDGCVICK